MRRKRGGRLRAAVRWDAELRRFSTTGRRAAGRRAAALLDNRAAGRRAAALLDNRAARRRAAALLANHRAKPDKMSVFLGMFLSF